MESIVLHVIDFESFISGGLASMRGHGKQKDMPTIAAGRSTYRFDPISNPNADVMLDTSTELGDVLITVRLA
jgi:hypothetical protein